MRTAYISHRLRRSAGNGHEAAGWRRLALRLRVDRHDRRLRAAVVVHRDARVFLTMRPMTWLAVRLNHDALLASRQRDRTSVTLFHAQVSHSVKRADHGVRADASLPAHARPALAGSRLHRDGLAEPARRIGGAAVPHSRPRVNSISTTWRVRIRQDDPGQARVGMFRAPDAPRRSITAPRPYRAAVAPVSRGHEPSSGDTVRDRDSVASASAFASASPGRASTRRITWQTTPRDTRMHWTSPSARAIRAPGAPVSELVWASASRPTRAVETTRPVMPDARSAPAPSAHDPAWQADIVARACEVVRREMLGGAVVERLAEDVMRRIDRRSRIERERRGL